MGRFQREGRFAAVLAVLAGMLGWQGLVVGGPASALEATAATTTLRGVDRHCPLVCPVSGSAPVAAAPSPSPA